MDGAAVLDGLAGDGSPAPRLLVVMAHPDDEVLALGGRMERLIERGVRFLCVTDGAPRDGGDMRAHGFGSLEEYRRARRAELRCALELAGLPAACAVELQGDGGEVVADGEAAYRMAEIAQAVRGEIEAFRPEAVLTHPYEGGHPDHDAVAFAVWAAVRALTEPEQPVVVEAAGYHAGSGGETVWMETGCFLRGSDEGVARELTAEEQARRRARLGCFGSQRETLAQFGVERERFRVGPAYDFSRPPHEGTLFYEAYPFGMPGERWRELARAAGAELGL